MTNIAILMEFELEDSLKMMWKSLNKEKPKPQNEREPPESAPSSSSSRSNHVDRISYQLGK